jgi:hypothetical protein
MALAFCGPVSLLLFDIATIPATAPPKARTTLKRKTPPIKVGSTLLAPATMQKPRRRKATMAKISEAMATPLPCLALTKGRACCAADGGHAVGGGVVNGCGDTGAWRKGSCLSGMVTRGSGMMMVAAISEESLLLPYNGDPSSRQKESVSSVYSR